MTVHSHTAVHQTAVSQGGATPEFPRHVVTAVLVAHDGARWLPDALAGLLGQERPVQDAFAADTGSADDSAHLVTEALGPDRVLHLARRTGFGQAVDEVHRTAPVLTPEDLPYLKRPSGWDPVTRTWRDETYDLPDLPHGEPVQWLWLLHDDCAPAPDALAHMLAVVEREAEAGREVAVVGPKLRGWYDRRQLLEAGVTIANSGRRWTGLDRREQDQGQHDFVRPALAVSTAGMLIRRDVYEELGGFDRRLPLMRDDIDLCWRAQSRGHRVLVAPEAVVRHAEAASRERRDVDCVGRTVASPHRVDKAGAVYTLLVNSPGSALPWVLLRLVLGTVLRTVAYLVGKLPGQALDEIRGLLGVLLRPERILAGRRRRARPVAGKDELRELFPPRGATLRATLEQAAGSMTRRSDPEATTGAGRHGGGGDADEAFVQPEQHARLKRIARNPAPVLFALLLLVSLVACRSLFSGGALAGGALLPAPDSAFDLWASYTSAWHPVGAGGTGAAPPYLAVIAALGTLFGGSAGLAVTFLLVCSVPLAGLSAYFASRPLVPSRLLRAWASVVYAFLPAATGALAGGRLGTAVLAMVLPLTARAAVAASGLTARGDARGTWRATWAYTLLLTLTTAFTPIVWPLALVVGIAVLVIRRRDLVPYALRLVAQLGTPLLVLAPWSFSLLPTGFFSEAGMDFGVGAASPLDLLGASPGGPGTVGGLLLIGVVLAALAALVREGRRTPVVAAWAVALTALLFAALSNGSAWAGPATLVYGLALLCAAAVGADGARSRVAEQSFGWRQPVAALIALAAAVGPLIAAVGWMVAGAEGPLERRDPVQVPAFVAEESGDDDQARTLVLDSTSPAHVGYTLVRGSGARLGDADVAAALGDSAVLDRVVAHLVAGSGADQTDELGDFAIRYVLVRPGAPREITRVLDATPGLSRLSQQDGSGLWRLDREISRAVILPTEDASAGKAQPVAAGPVDITGRIPAGPEGRVLRLADTFDDGWTATVDGAELTPVKLDGWAQGFRLPPGGGALEVTHENSPAYVVWLVAQGLLALTLIVLALPGGRRDIDDDLPEEAPEITAEDLEGDSRRARRLRAQAEAEAAAQAAALPRQQSDEPFPGPSGPPAGAARDDDGRSGGAPAEEAYAAAAQDRPGYEGGGWPADAYDPYGYAPAGDAAGPAGSAGYSGPYGDFVAGEAYDPGPGARGHHPGGQDHGRGGPYGEGHGPDHYGHNYGSERPDGSQQ
ncbi:glycosyltransferase family 2 protein [Streptomyces chilikensis]|uniref:Glycosyltransferase family 2 protein n=1 Tax=Streptomyces chilikensis TaxID=1194079 RepID=A0ABV3EV02_9ACTN